MQQTAATKMQQPLYGLVHVKKHQKLDLVRKFRPSETISRQNIASKIESLRDRRGRKIKKKKTKMPILGRCKNVRFSE